jgi:RHS repeat-associated protein
VRDVVASDGTTVGSRLLYDPWGNVTETGTVLSDFTYTGHHYDRPAGLSLAWYRGYEPNLGRWLSKDPLGLKGGLNLYGYVNNEPIDRTDPLGLYGTNDCSYYDTRCKENGGSYYCEDGPKWCPFFPSPPDPNPNDEFDHEGWPRCVRQCLQDRDRPRRNPSCEEPNNSGPWYPTNPAWDDHVVCYTECFFDGTFNWLD